MYIKLAKKARKVTAPAQGTELGVEDEVLERKSEKVKTHNESRDGKAGQLSVDASDGRRLRGSKTSWQYGVGVNPVTLPFPKPAGYISRRPLGCLCSA
jgi:hypothetical protein